MGTCESIIKVIARDTASPLTKTTPGYTIRVSAQNSLVLSGTNTFSDATLARGASSSVFDLSNYFNGGDGDITYSATTDDNTCVSFTLTGDDFTLTAHNAGTKPAQCIANIVVTATDSNAPTPQTIDTSSFAITVPAVPPPLATTGTIDAVSLDKNANGSVANIESFFTGGTGTVTYSAVSAAPACVTVNTITQSSGAYTLPITTTAGSNACSSLITVTATDSSSATKTQTFTVYTPRLKLVNSTSIANQDLTRGTAAITISNIAQYFEGGIRPDITYSTSVVTNSITPNSETVCVTVTQPDGSNDFTVTPTAVATVTNCTATVSVRAYDGDRTRTTTFTATVTPPVIPITVTSAGSATGPITYRRGFSFSVDLTEWFSGGTGTFTFSASSSDTSCVATNVAGNTLTITAHLDSNIVGECTSTIKATATDTAGTTKDTPGLATRIFAPDAFTLSGANTFSSATLARGASSAVFDLTDYINGGNGDITYSATTDDNTCVDFTLTGDDSNLFTYTAHNTAAKTAQCVANIVVTATDSHAPTPQTIDTSSFAITVPAAPIPITLTTAGNFAGNLERKRASVTDNDLTTWFSGGTGALTFSATSSNQNCVAINVAGNTLITTAHLDSTIAGQCTSTIKVTATDTTGATKDTPGYTIQVLAPTPFNLSGANTFSDATLARGASSAVFDLTDYIEGGDGDITYSATTDDNTCVSFTLTGDDFTLTAHNAGTKPAQCIANIVVTATDSNAPTPQTIDTSSFAITVPAVPPPLATTGTIDAVSLDKNANGSVANIESFFTGGTGTVTYSAVSAAPACVTVNTITQSSGAYTLPITTTAGSNACSSLITVTATDSSSATKTQTFTVYTPRLKLVNSTSIANQDLTRGTAAITISNIAQYFEGGIRPDITYSTSVVTNSITPNSETVCVTVTQPDGSNDFTVTPTAVATVTNCTATVSVRAYDGDRTRTTTFTATVTPPVIPITVTSAGNFASTVTAERGDVITSDLTTWFSGGTGTLTFSATSSNQNCVAINVAGNTLTITAHLDSTIAGQCTSIIKATATDTTGATKDTPGYTIRVLGKNTFNLSGANTFSDATLARGASSAVFDLTDYIEGGDGDITYSATTDDNTCVDFTLTGDDSNLFTYTAHNTAAKTAQCVANIVVTATDSHAPTPQTIDTSSFAITVPAVTTTPSTPPTTTPSTPNPLRLTANGNSQTNFAFGRSSSRPRDLATHFTGGTGPFTYTVTSSNPSCITVDVAGATLTTTSHKDSTIIEECSSLIRITATDSTSPTPQTITTPGFTERVFALDLIRYGESGDSTFSNISLQRGASNINAINLNDYFSGGLGLFAYTVTSSNENCVSFTLTGDDSNLLTLTAHNDANRAAQCSSNIVVTATTSIEVPPQVLPAPPFTVTVPAIPRPLRASPTTRLPNITLVEGRSTTVQNLFQYFQRGTTPYTFTASTDDATNCAQNTATINANTLTLTAHTDNAGECASTLVTVTATDTAGDTATQTLTLTVRDPSTSSGGGGGGSSRRSFRASNVEFETITLSEGETHTIENLGKYFIHGSQPYSYAVTNHTQSKCEENEVDIHRDTLTLQATDTYSLSCSQTDLTITATDNRGRDIKRDLSFTIEKTQHTDTPEKAITTTQQSFTPQKATQQTQQEQTTQTLSFGSTHPEVQTLQQFLNKQGFLVAQTGPGSPGQETTYFGTATQRALKAYQQSRSIPQTGILDETTKTAIVVDNTIEMLIIRILTISMQIVELQIQELQEKAQ